MAEVLATEHAGRTVRAPLEAQPPLVLPHAPEELLATRLKRLGEGLGRVVYASEHWVVKRERSQASVLALILIWKFLTRTARLLPGHMGDFLLRHPSRWIRLPRVLLQGFVVIVPKSLWLMTHTGQIWRQHAWRDLRGHHLAQRYLSSESLVPLRVIFPPVRVRVTGWPGWLLVSEATERVECTLYEKLHQLVEAGQYEEFDRWLDRFFEFRRRAWQKGVFSVDAHLKNYGVIGDRIVLVDPGGLTDHWAEVEEHLTAAEASATEPHRKLGLGRLFANRPDLAAHFDARWRENVSTEVVRDHWPESTQP